MEYPPEVMHYYIVPFAITATIVVAYSMRWVLKAWNVFEGAPWKAKSFLHGLLALLVASLLEMPLLGLFAVNKLIGALLLGIFVGPIEEGSKLLPLKVLPEGGWRDWRKTIGAAFFLGVIEGILYMIELAALGEWRLIPIRFLVMFLHVIWTFIALTVWMAEGKLWGYFLASALHSLYDLPGLAYAGGVSGAYFKAACVGGLLSLITMFPVVKKVGEKAVIFLEEEKIGVHLPKWFTSSP